MADEPARNVIEALARVAAELPGIGKDSHAAPDQGGYAYRGIEAITQAAQPLLAKHGVVFVPAVQLWTRDEVRVGKDQKLWHDELMQIIYTVYGPGGVDDKIEVGPIPAIGRDGADKGANKCMTQAFKYALLQLLCVSDSKDDSDGHTHEADSAEASRSVSARSAGRLASDKQRFALERLIEQHGPPEGCAWPLADDLTMRDASGYLDTLKKLPPQETERRSTMRGEPVEAEVF